MKEVIKYTRWGFGILFFFGALASLTTHPLLLFPYLVMAIVVCPYTSKMLNPFLEKSEVIKKSKNPTRSMKIGKWSLLLIALVLLISFSPKDEASETNKKIAQSQPTQIITTSAPKPTQPMNTPKPTNTPEPTPTSIPLDSNGFPMDYESVTIAQIAKMPSAYNKKRLMFTCEVSSFAKNESGDAAAINCDDPNDYASIIQVSGIWDYTKINSGDIARIYGLGMGADKGKNAFGGDVTMGIVLGMYINDLTSGYKSTFNK